MGTEAPMDWQDVFEVVDDWTLKTASPAWDVRQAAADTFTLDSVGYYYNPNRDLVGIYANGSSRSEIAWCKEAAARAVGRDHVEGTPLTLEILGSCAPWIKVAYSPTLRRLGELLNFFPGQYFGGIPNAPSPLAALLTSGLVGAGLGWGTGKLISKFAPEGYGENLGRTGAILGGLVGALPGAIWSGVNLHHGRSLLDPWPLNHRAGEPPVHDTRWMNGPNMPPELIPPPKEVRGNELEEIPLSPRYLRATEVFSKQAFDRAGWVRDAYAMGDNANVNIDAMGRTLWELDAPPALAATTMGALYAAQQLPDPSSRPGMATGHQLGQLAMTAAGDYAKGYLVGAAINGIIGTPYKAPVFGLGGAALGVLSAVVPKLFGG